MEDFLELFTTIMVAYVFVLLGVVRPRTATRVVYLDVILYSIGGGVGTMHHLYFSGAPAVHMALGAFFGGSGCVYGGDVESYVGIGDRGSGIGGTSVRTTSDARLSVRASLIDVRTFGRFSRRPLGRSDRSTND